MNILKQLAIVALVCCGQSIFATQQARLAQGGHAQMIATSAAINQQAINARIAAVTPASIEAADDATLYQLFGVPNASPLTTKSEVQRDTILYLHRDVIEDTRKGLVAKLLNEQADESLIDTALDKLGTFYARNLKAGIKRHSEKLASRNQ